jgi:hypothetical protein
MLCNMVEKFPTMQRQSSRQVSRLAETVPATIFDIPDWNCPGDAFVSHVVARRLS